MGLWWPAEMYMRTRYGQPLGSNAIALIFETNRQELMEQFLANWHLVFFGIAVSSGFLLLGAFFLYRSKARWYGNSRFLILTVSISMIALILAQYMPYSNAGQDSSADSAAVTKSPFDDAILDVYPLNVATALMDIREHRIIVAQAQTSMHGFDFGAKANSAYSADIVVLVVGESAKAKRWQLYGAERETTPFLAKEKNLIVLQDVIAPAVSTRVAVPAIVSRKPFIEPTGNHIASGAEPSIARAFEQAGYATYWWSNQAITGIYDTSTAIYASHSQQTLWLNPVSTNVFNPGKSTYDSVLLSPFEKILNTSGRKFVVMHTMGSHFNYRDRYPAEFNRFYSSVEFNGMNTYGSGNKVDFQNAYDNSIIYTDWLLHEIFEKLRTLPQSAMVFYISDHGEDIWDEACFQIDIDRRSAASYHVPALVWFNDKAILTFDDTFNAIKANASLPLVSGYMPQTIMSAAGILVRSPDKRDLTHANITLQTRMVAGFSGEMVDYDKAKQENYCDIR